MVVGYLWFFLLLSSFCCIGTWMMNLNSHESSPNTSKRGRNEIKGPEKMKLTFVVYDFHPLAFVSLLEEEFTLINGGSHALL